jgi:NADH:ubiquinone oxidoreductase subunit F (NADH-binding)
VHNVETLASVPWIVLNGGEAYAQMGFSTSRGTKAISFASLFKRPGLYEIDFGIPLGEVLEGIGGGLKTGPMKAAMVGGPLAGIIHPREMDTPFAFHEMQAIGAAVGHGGIVAFDQNTRMVDLLVHIFSFGAFESCGKCTPCRVGSREAQLLLREAASGRKIDRAEFERLVQALSRTSLCGHGTGLGEVAQSFLDKFGGELSECFA